MQVVATVLLNIKATPRKEWPQNFRINAEWLTSGNYKIKADVGRTTENKKLYEYIFRQIFGVSRNFFIA